MQANTKQGMIAIPGVQEEQDGVPDHTVTCRNRPGRVQPLPICAGLEAMEGHTASIFLC
jgi:hypothetical protein